MDNIYIISLVIAVIYTVFKIIEMRFLDEDDKKSLKYIIRDSLFVYFSSIITFFLIDQIAPSIKSLTNIKPTIFTSDPGF